MVATVPHEAGYDGAAEPAPARRSAPLHMRFALAGSVVMLIGALVIGAWVSREIESSVTRNSAISTALYMESFIAPLSQELSERDVISPETALRLRTLFAEPPLSERIATVKIWKKGGLVAYSNNADIVGRTFPPSAPLKAAWRGELSAAFDDLDHPEDYVERQHGTPYLEVYNPIHSIYTGEIIAVAEFYQAATELERDLFEARRSSWLLVAGVSLTMFALLFGIVRQGSRTIARQTDELQRRFDQVAHVSEQNSALRRRIQAASLRAGEHNERFLRRISAELHDGPAQALALAALRLDEVLRRRMPEDGAPLPEAETVRRSLGEAMREIRQICRGLSLPEIENKSLPEVIALVVETHERRTGSKVALDGPACAAPDRKLDRATLICLYRFVQEGLMNAWRHAGGAGARVRCGCRADRVELSVIDDGPGFDPGAIDVDGTRLGLRGLRERVESTGGRFTVRSRPGGGTRLTATLWLTD